jgi:hypothetical protein
MTPADRARAIPLAVIVCIVASGAVAHAQSADAEALFRQGRTLIKNGDVAGGCDKLAASERLETSVGTLLNLGDCREKLGKYASAWAAFRKAEAMAQRAGTDEKRRLEASRRAAALEPKLSNIVVNISHPVDGLIVRRDDEVLDRGSLGTALPIDAGKLTISAEAPGYMPWHVDVEIDAHDKHRVVEVPALVAAPKSVVLPRIEPAFATRRVDTGTWTGTRKAALVLGIAGAGAFGTGIYFGVHAKNLQDDADRRCPLSICDDPVGLHFNDRAQSAARTANILYIAGGAAVATAVVMWLVGGPGDETVVVPTAGDHQVGLSLIGRL